MFEFLKVEEDALSLLKSDHDTVKELFKQFKETESMEEKKAIAVKAIQELRIHATIEEELFYPALRGREEVDQSLLEESDEEHHVAKLLIAELMHMTSEDHFAAKFTVLAENIEHHVKEEENELFPQARKTNVDFVKLGEQLKARKEQLMTHGIPLNAEEKLMSRGIVDSPADAARRNHPRTPLLAA
jgi:hypothetical protein